MTTPGITRELARERRSNIFMCAVLAAVGFLMTMYSASLITSLIARWLVRPY